MQTIKEKLKQTILSVLEKKDCSTLPCAPDLIRVYAELEKNCPSEKEQFIEKTNQTIAQGIEQATRDTFSKVR